MTKYRKGESLQQLQHRQKCEARLVSIKDRLRVIAGGLNRAITAQRFTELDKSLYMQAADECLLEVAQVGELMKVEGRPQSYKPSDEVKTLCWQLIEKIDELTPSNVMRGHVRLIKLLL